MPNKPLLAFHSQKWMAKKRGIEFKLTFKEWLDWWGDDIALRGRCRDNLQMQRIGDLGAYELGNIIKGTPKQNMVTKGRIQRQRNAANKKSFEAQYQELMKSYNQEHQISQAA